MLVETFFTVIVLLSTLYLWSQWKPKGYPNGPWGYPLLGHLPLIGNAPFQKFIELKSKYGSIVAIDFGLFPTIAISDYKLIREANNEFAFTGRPDLQPFLDRSGGKRRGVLFADGDEWVQQRKFTFKHLKDFGFGKHSEESIINEEYSIVMAHLKKLNGQPLSLRDKLNFATINSLWVLTTSERFELGDPNLSKILNAVNQNIAENNGLAAAGMFFPWITKTFPKFSGYDNMMKDLQPLLDFLDEPILHHKKTHVPNQPRDFLDVYLDKIKRTTDPFSSFYRETGDISMRTVLLDLFTAGTETTNNTISFFALYLATYPKVQDKLHDLIDSQIGRNRLPRLDDREQLPYFEATMMEVIRITSIISSGIFRKVLYDVEFHGYKFPKDTMVIMNYYSANHDKEYWGDPETFRPERFLSDDQSKILNHDAYQPFGTGRRECPGKRFAYNQIFLAVVQLLQNFEIKTDESQPPPSLEPIVSFVLTPKPHQLVFVPRA